MTSSSLSSRGCERTKSGWKAATLPRTPIATRTDDDARGANFDGVVADAAPGRLSRNKPRHGMALRGGARDAGAKGERSSKSAPPYRARPRIGHWHRDSGSRVLGHGAAAHCYPLLRRLAPGRPWNLLPGWALAPEVGPHAGGLSGPDSLVVSDGLGARRRVDGTASVAGQQYGRSGRPDRSRSHSCRHQPSIWAVRYHGPHNSLSCSHGHSRVAGLS